MIKQNAYFKLKAPMPFLLLLLMSLSYQTASAQQEEPMVRMAEIEIDSAYPEEYKAILKEDQQQAPQFSISDIGFEQPRGC